MSTEAGQQLSIPLNAVNPSNIVVGFPRVHIRYVNEENRYVPPYTKSNLQHGIATIRLLLNLLGA
jgi:hypothetical protein